SQGPVQTPSGADTSCERFVRTTRSVVVGDSAGPLVVEMPFRITDRVASLGRGLVLGLRRGGLVCRRRRRVRPVLVSVGLGGRRTRAGPQILGLRREPFVALASGA